MDHQRQRLGGVRRRDTRDARDVRADVVAPPRLSAAGDDRRGRTRPARARRRRHRRRGDRRTAGGARHRCVGHDRLHVGHHRQAEGMHAHASQPADERGAEPRRHRLRAATRRQRSAVPAAGSHTHQDHRAVRDGGGLPGGVRHRHPAPAGGVRVDTADGHLRGAADLREGVQLHASPRTCRAQGVDLRPRRRRRHPLVARTSSRSGDAVDGCGPRGVRPARVRQGACGPGRQPAIGVQRWRAAR